MCSNELATGGQQLLAWASPTFAGGAAQGAGSVLTIAAQFAIRVTFSAVVNGLNPGQQYTFYPQFLSTTNTSEFDVLCGAPQTAGGSINLTAKAA